MAETKDKLATVEQLKLVYDVLKGIFELPEYSSANNGCILGIQNGALAWIRVENSDITEVDADAVGTISNTNNIITINSDSITQAGTYTLYYEDENNTKLNGWDAIATVEVS